MEDKNEKNANDASGCLFGSGRCFLCFMGAQWEVGCMRGEESAEEKSESMLT